MEHILQFGVNIDEDRIVKTAEDRAATELINYIHKSIDNLRGNVYGEDALRDIAREEIAKVVDANKEKIIEQATEKLAEKLARSKIVKDTLKGLVK